MTKDSAEEILKHEFGNRKCMCRAASGAFSVQVIQAIRVLDGKYQNGWGITKLPNWHEV